MHPDRRGFLKLAGVSAGSMLVAACGGEGEKVAAIPPDGGSTAPPPAAPPPNPPAPPPTQGGPADGPAPSDPPPPTPEEPPPVAEPPPPTGEVGDEVSALKSYLRISASPTLSLPEVPPVLPTISWAGPLTAGPSVATTLPSGVIIPMSSPLIGGPARHRLVQHVSGNPSVEGHPCLAIIRSFSCKGIARTLASPTVIRFKTDAPVFELTGVVPEGGGVAAQSLIVDGWLVPPKVLASSRGAGGGWNVATVRVEFGSRAVRDIWMHTALTPAYLKVDAQDVVLPAEDAAEPQLTVIGDSYLQARADMFPNTAGIAFEVAARLGIRKLTVDAIGGTGYWNSSTDLGNLNDRLPGHAADDSTIYLVLAGLNDYGDNTSSGLVWPSRAVYEEAVRGYMRKLRAAQPNALIVVTAPFCPIPPMSDSGHKSFAGTNSSGVGDFLYKAELHKDAIRQVAGPWVYIDVLMGSGWLNSSGATGDITGLQWFTGGTPGSGTSATYKPGNTLGGGGGAYGGIASIPVLSGGLYSQAPDITAIGGTGTGLQVGSKIDTSGRLTALVITAPGHGYTPGAGLPEIQIDPTFQINPAALGTPVLHTAVNPDGQYPLMSFAPAGATRAQLNNIYRLLMTDKTHPSPLGVSYISSRLARNILDAVMAL